MRYPWERSLGDTICQVCPRWDAATGTARPCAGPRVRALIDLAAACKLTGTLPCAGGMLDQDAEILDAVLAVWQSDWWREVWRE